MYGIGLQLEFVQNCSPSDNCNAIATILCEKHFLMECILKGATVIIQNTEASIDDDRIHSLNAIISQSDNSINEKPSQEHENYNRYLSILHPLQASCNF